jgi:two-component system chemotaxis sensor kinase CheA
MHRAVIVKLRELARVSTAVSSGRFEFVMFKDSQDEIGVLKRDFNQMVHKLKDQLETLTRLKADLEDANKSLEEKVEERTASLVERERSIRLMLDGSPDAFVTVSLDGTIHPEHSKVLTDWFGVIDQDIRIWNYLFPNDKRASEAMECIMDDGLIDPDFLRMNSSHLPSTVLRNNRTYCINYLEMAGSKKDNSEGELKLLLIIHDVTDEIAAKRQEEKKMEFVNLCSLIIKDKDGFLAFYNSTTALIETACSAANPKVEVLRALHTIKGNCATYAVHSMAKAAHELETELMEGFEERRHKISVIMSIWKETTSSVLELVETGDSGEMKVAWPELQNLLELIKNGAGFSDVEEYIESFKRDRVISHLKRIQTQAEATATRLEKENVKVVISDSVGRVPDRSINRIWPELIHIIRNAIDHGVDTPEERRKFGKDSDCRISIESRFNERKHFELVIADDGAGINWDKLKEKGKKIGAPIDSEEDLQNLIFLDGVSSRDQVSETSGRGVGLAAVKQIIDELGGSITVISKRHYGTQFVLDFGNGLGNSQRLVPIRPAS